jgi:hypothetical protein
MITQAGPQGYCWADPTRNRTGPRHDGADISCAVVASNGGRPWAFNLGSTWLVWQVIAGSF